MRPHRSATSPVGYTTPTATEAVARGDGEMTGGAGRLAAWPELALRPSRQSRVNWKRQLTKPRVSVVKPPRSRAALSYTPSGSTTSPVTGEGVRAPGSKVRRQRDLTARSELSHRGPESASCHSPTGSPPATMGASQSAALSADILLTVGPGEASEAALGSLREPPLTCRFARGSGGRICTCDLWVGSAPCRPLPNVAGCRRILRVDEEESSLTVPTVADEPPTHPAESGGLMEGDRNPWERTRVASRRRPLR